MRLKICHALQLSAIGIILSGTQVQCACAESFTKVPIMKGWQIKAKPRICVKPLIYPMCTMSTDIIWNGRVNADICLLSSQTQTHIKCWSDVQTGDILQEITTDIDIIYWISYINENTVLAETTVRIVNVPQRQIRRRRRHIWSLL